MSTPPDRLTTALADRYRIERELGQGGMATVYLAEDVKHKRKVALKVLKPELAAVLGAERFVQEITTTAALQHPHILPLFDSGTADGFLFYVMPFIDGETLRSKLDRETQLGIDEAVKITTAVADALDYAHRHGVIHRDIKPENILLHEGRPMVADFGIALAVSAAAGGRMTETGLSLGTPHYMSPEQATAEKEITARSDVYSLGSVLYEMLTGNPPHTGASAQQIIMKIVTEEAAPVTRLRKSVPPNVAAAVAKSVERLPADRFATAADFAVALENPGFRITGVAGGPGAPAGARSRLSDPVFLGVAALALAAVAVLVARGTGSDGAQAPMSVSQHTFASEAIFAARYAPDGQTMVFSAAASGFMPRLYVIRPDYPEPQPLGRDSLHLLAISSTGELAVLTNPFFLQHRVFFGTLARMPFGGGAPRELATGVWEADWSPDGEKLAILKYTTEGDVLEYPIGRELYRGTLTGNLTDLRVSPSGDRIAFFEHPRRGDDRGVVMMVDSSGAATTLSEEFWGVQGLAWEPGGKTVLFSGAREGGAYQVHRAGVGVVTQIVLPAPGSLTIHDVSRDGTWLVGRDDQPLELLVRAPGASEAQNLSWLDRSSGADLSGDGQLMAFSDQSEHAGNLYAVMLRRTDGSPAVRLGEGNPQAISPDKRWVLAQVPTVPSQWRLYPTGAGEMQPLDWPSLESVTRVEFFPDGGSLLVCGREPGKANRCYRGPLDASSLEPVTPDSIGFGFVRPGGQALLHRDQRGWWIHPLDGGEPTLIPGLTGIVLRWSPDGSALWVKSQVRDQLEVDALDVATGRRTPLLRLEAPKDVPGFQVLSVSLADDPRVYAFGTWRRSSTLFSILSVK